jgi:predicted nucleic acid-binding protein
VAATDTETEAVADAGPLIHLDELGCLDLFSDFSSVTIPTAVRIEVEAHRPGAPKALPESCHFVPSPHSPGARTTAVFRAFGLGAGEREALLLMEGRPGAIFLSDDAAARLAAKALGFRSYGTLGVLLRSLRRRRRTQSEVLVLLQTIPRKSSLYLRKELLLEVIEQVRTFQAPRG